MSSWGKVVSSALVGVRNRPIDPAGTDPVIADALASEGSLGDGALGDGAPDDRAPGDPAVAALNLAALTAAAGAACSPTPIAAQPIPAAPDDPRPLMSDMAAAYAIRAMDISPGMTTWCLRALADSGRRPPTGMLPGLLERTARNVAIRPVVTTVVGPRGQWLAEYAPELKAVLDMTALAAASAPSSFTPASSTPHRGVPADPDDQNSPETAESVAAQAWTHGETHQRIDYLTTVRDRDPAAARELLAAGWAKEDGTNRELLLPVLARNISLADEEFLERALDDRRAKVRAAAAALLDRIDGSAHQRRLLDAVAPLVTLTEERRRLIRHPVLQATLPTDPDPALARDGIGLTAPHGLGIGTHVLTQLLSRIPPRHWEQRFGMPAAQLAAAIGLDQPALVTGLSRGAIAFHDASWASALMTRLDADADVLAVADPHAVVREFANLPVARQLSGLQIIPTPWPQKLAETAFAALLRDLKAPDHRRPGIAWFEAMYVGLPATDAWREAVTVAAQRFPVAANHFAVLDEAIRIRSVLIRELQ